jgi:putative membrane protein
MVSPTEFIGLHLECLFLLRIRAYNPSWERSDIMPYMYYPSGGWFWFGPASWIIFFIVFMIIGRLFWWGGHRHGRYRYDRDMPSHEDPLTVLKTRYAKGEITKKEYDDMKKDISD